jgi:hypothetical protein
MRFLMIPFLFLYGIVRLVWDILTTVLLVLSLPFLLLFKSIQSWFDKK